ncbi:MAG: PKD domain-containing protein [Bacteroidetes bacterium]|nr:PKD domain-containing protein [Bacteroidota bacterium]
MHRSITSGTSSRILGQLDDKDGGMYVITNSSSFNSCGDVGMTAVDCSVPPSTDFSADQSGTCDTTLTVKFTDLSSNLPTSWSWNFGDGSTSTVKNPSHTYTAIGSYDVRLIAGNGSGGDTLTRKRLINVTGINPTTASCEPDSSGLNDCCDIGILQLEFGSVNNITTGTAVYHDYSCSQIIALIAGGDYTIDITTGPDFDEDVRVYIDWNNNGILAAGELEFSSNDARTHSGTISIPCDAIKDTLLGMRIRSDWSGSDVISSSCENIEFGQGEDYSLIIYCDTLNWLGTTDTVFNTKTNWEENASTCSCHVVSIPGTVDAPTQPTLTVSDTLLGIIINSGAGGMLSIDTPAVLTIQSL